MKALVCYDKGVYRFEPDYPEPETGIYGIKIKVEGCGICAGDVKAYNGAEMYWGNEIMPPHVKVPCIPGHEFIGHIVEIGPEADCDFKIGDRVSADPILPCGKCRFCMTGQYWMCQDQAVFGFRYYVNGGMAEYMVLPKGSLVHKIPDDIAIERIVLAEPFSCSKHAVDKANLGSDDVVAISGAGTLGLGMVAIAKRRTPKHLIAIDMFDERLEKAKELGADIVINPSRQNLDEIIRELTDGYGCDVYIEAAGHPSSVVQGLQIIRKLGTFIEFGVFGAPTNVDWTIIGNRKELNLFGAHLGPYCFPPVIDWIADGSLPTDGIVTHIYALEDWQEAFKMADGNREAIKVMIRP